MGSDRNYLVVEPASDADPDAVADALREDGAFDRRVGRHGGSVVGVGLGGEDEVRHHLEAVAGEVERALLVHVRDTTATGVGTLYEGGDGDLEAVDTLEGAERYGVDVLDYFTREHGIDAPR